MIKEMKVISDIPKIIIDVVKTGIETIRNGDNEIKIFELSTMADFKDLCAKKDVGISIVKNTDKYDSIISYFGLGLYMEMRDMKHIEKAEVYYVRLTKEESIKFQNKLKEYNKTHDLRIWLE